MGVGITMADISVSVVIPTRNRPESLHRVLTALAGQSRQPDEVIVSDASDSPLDGRSLSDSYPGLRLTHFRLAPSVCAQRNEGIRRAGSTHILLCDDDIEPPPDYLERLVDFIERHPETGAVTGVVCEPDAAGQFSDGIAVPSFRSLLISFVTQRSVSGDVEAVVGNVFTNLPLALLKRWYRYRGNTWSLSGWPLITQLRTPIVRRAVCGLGAALVRRDWLLASPYDEWLSQRLGPHGIGDNYGVALGFPGDNPIALLTDLRVHHHKEKHNRLDLASYHYQRALALHYFMRRSPRFSPLNEAFLVWSLFFNAAEFGILGRTDLFRASLRALRVVVTGRNPLFADIGPAAGSSVPESRL